MIVIVALLALAIGILVGNLALGNVPVSNDISAYLGVTVIAGLDSVLGGIKSYLSREFRTDVFVSGFFVNSLVAGLFAWMGDQLGVNMFLAALLVLGWRIFNNIGLIRRQLLTQIMDARRQREIDKESQVA